MKRDPAANLRQWSFAPEAQGQPHVSIRSPGAGDRTVCGVLVAAVIVAVALAAA